MTTNESKRIVVTGMGAVSSLGWGVAPMWEALLRGECGIRPLTKLDPEQHRVKHAAEVPEPPTPNPDADVDPAIRFTLAAGCEALEQANVLGKEKHGVALVLGSNFGAMTSTEKLLADATNAMTCPLMDDVTGIVAKKLELGGVRSTLSLSCASGNAAIGRGVELIRSGAAQIVFAGGYDAIDTLVWAGLCGLRAMSAKALRPFDILRDGTIFGEGAGVLVLESAAFARERGVEPLAELLGYATGSDAFHMTHPDPEGAGMARVMAAALRDCGIAPDAVDHVNAHATGTKYNDRLETAAIKSVFGDHAQKMPICGLKSMLGHAMGAASVLEAIATVMTIRKKIIPPTIGLVEPDPDCDLDYVPLTAREASVRIALNNSAGFGGCNASVVFKNMKSE